jgi:cytochrome c-type biogenesis protein CcmH/NrfG
MNRTDRLPAARSVVAVCLLAAPLVAGAFGSTGWSWAWDHLHRVPTAWPLALLLLAVALAVPGVARRFPAAVDAVGDALARRPLPGPMLLGAAALAAFAVFPIATRMYGDSLTILNRHGPGDLDLHLRRLLDPGLASRGAAVALLHDVLERASGLSYEACYRLLSSLCGGAFVFLHVRLAATLPGLRGWARATIVWLGLVDGANQLFFGHVENYAVPRLLATAFLMLAVRRLLAAPAPPTPRRALALLPPLAGAVVLHAQWLVLLPVAALLLARDLGAVRPALARWSGARGAVVLGGTGVVAIMLAYAATGAWCYDYLYTGGLPEPRQVLLPLSAACVGQPWLRYTVFSGAHLVDLAGSLWSVSSPAILLVIVLLWRRGWRPAQAHVPAVAAVAAFLHNLVLNPSIGFPFDWDLMCVVSPPLLYTAVLLVATAGARAAGDQGSGDDQTAAPASRPPAWLAPLVLLGLGTATVFAVNAGRDSSYRRVEDMGVWLHRSYHGGSHYRLSGNLSTIAEAQAQDRERERVLARLAPQAFAGDGEVAFLWERLGRLRAGRGDFAGALVAYRASLAVDPDNLARRREAGWLETEAGDESAGIAHLEAYLGHAPGDAEAWRHLGLVRARRGEVAAARAAWERFLRLAPDGPGAAEVRADLEALGPGPAR